MSTSREATSRDRTGAAPASGVGGYYYASYLPPVQCKPTKAISIIEADVNVDFAPPKDYQDCAALFPFTIDQGSSSVLQC